MSYAEKTSVTVEKSKAEVERILTRYGPSCMRAQDCMEACGKAGVQYFGPTRGGGASECICNGSNEKKVEP